MTLKAPLLAAIAIAALGPAICVQDKSKPEMTKEQVADWLLKHGFDYCVDDKIFIKGVRDEGGCVEIALTEIHATLTYRYNDTYSTFRSRIKEISVSNDDELTGMSGFTRKVKQIVYNT